VKKRARLDEEKANRRMEILNAARSVLDLQSHALPTASAIAKKAGLAKGTLYIYFRTKEEIYLALLAEGLVEWIEAVRNSIKTDKPKPDAFIREFVGFGANNPRTLFLACLSPVIMERNISEKTAYLFKKKLAEEITDTAILLAKVYPSMTPKMAARFCLHGYLLALGLWQQSNPPPVIGKVLKRKGLEVLNMDFKRELYAALKLLWPETPKHRSI